MVSPAGRAGQGRQRLPDDVRLLGGAGCKVRPAPFPAALEDCRCAVRWLRAHAGDYNLDPKHIGAYGNSAGGHLALLLGMAGPWRGRPVSRTLKPGAGRRQRQRPA